MSNILPKRLEAVLNEIKCLYWVDKIGTTVYCNTYISPKKLVSYKKYKIGMSYYYDSSTYPNLLLFAKNNFIEEFQNSNNRAYIEFYLKNFDAETFERIK